MCCSFRVRGEMRSQCMQRPERAELKMMIMRCGDAKRSYAPEQIKETWTNNPIKRPNEHIFGTQTHCRSLQTNKLSRVNTCNNGCGTHIGHTKPGITWHGFRLHSRRSRTRLSEARECVRARVCLFVSILKNKRNRINTQVRSLHIKWEEFCCRRRRRFSRF